MIIVDKALAKREEEGNPIRVGMVGAGFMGRGVARQIINATPGMRLVAVANRTIDTAFRAYREVGIEPKAVSKIHALNDYVRAGQPVVTDDPTLLTDAADIDVIFEITGAVEYSTAIVLRALQAGKHVVHMNAELDCTLGPILKTIADRHGVIYTNSSGDQPGVTLDLIRNVVGYGLKPVLAGNIKGLQDRYRNPTTQEGFAKQWGQNVQMVTSFADGTKISFEQATIANAVGMQVLRRGMSEVTVPSGTPLKEVIGSYPEDRLLDGTGGYVDYCVGAEPGPGVFVLATHDDPYQQHYLNLYKLGKGPFYLFYTPYHLCHFEAPGSIARAVLFGDATLEPLNRSYVDVVTTAKRDLPAGHILDGIGGYDTYGEAENAVVMLRDRILPMGLAEGCRLKRPISKDMAITYDDVELPPNRLADRLRAMQNEMLATPKV